jgi:hypothetical protein
MPEVADGLVAFATVMIGFSVLVLLVGLIKPKWILFWMQEPNRLMVSAVALVMFMVFFTWHTALTIQAKGGSVSQSKKAPDQGSRTGH